MCSNPIEWPIDPLQPQPSPSSTHPTARPCSHNFAAAVRVTEEAVLIDLSTPVPTTLTFARFDAIVSALAKKLHSEYPLGATVGIVGENSARWAAAFYAVIRAGLVAVPISYRHPAEVVSFIAHDSQLAAAFVADAYSNLLGRNGPTTYRLEEIDLSACDERFAVAVDLNQAATYLYTSGSTGSPKGVVHSHRSQLWMVGLGTETNHHKARLLLSAPLYHMGALAPLQRALNAGQSVVLLPRFDSGQVLRAIEEYGVTDLNVVPPMAVMLLGNQALSDTDVSSVTSIILNSAPASKELLTELQRVFNCPDLVFTYGTTESSPIAFTSPRDGRRIPFGAVGVPHPAVEVRLVDRLGQTVNDEGVLQIRSPGLMSGYHRRSDITTPITTDGYYHTKDIFRRDGNGFYYCLGREDDMFICGGENLYPRAIEIALESHPAVSHAAVVAVEDPVKGHKPVGFVSLLPGERASEEELRSYSLTKLEPVAHPRRIWFEDSLPLSPTNKVDKAALWRLATNYLQHDVDPIR